MAWEGPKEVKWDDYTFTCWYNSETGELKHLDFRNKYKTIGPATEASWIKSFYKAVIAAFENNSQVNSAVCQCSIKDLWNGHTANCPEKGTTLSQWQSKKYKY